MERGRQCNDVVHVREACQVVMQMCLPLCQTNKKDEILSISKEALSVTKGLMMGRLSHCTTTVHGREL
jgi:hypothetical protein